MGCQGYHWQLKRPTDQTDHIAQPQIHPGVNSLSHKSAFSLDSLQIYRLLRTHATNNKNLEIQKEQFLWKRYRREATTHQRAMEQVHYIDYEQRVLHKPEEVSISTQLRPQPTESVTLQQSVLMRQQDNRDSKGKLLLSKNLTREAAILSYLRRALLLQSLHHSNLSAPETTCSVRGHSSVTAPAQFILADRAVEYCFSQCCQHKY